MPSDLLTQLYNAYKDWCASNNLNPVGAHRLYTSVWEIFRISTLKRHRRRVLQGIQLVSEACPELVEGDAESPQSGADAAGAAGARQV